MRRLLVIVFLLCGLVSFAQEKEDSLVIPLRSTKSYLIADYADNDTAFLKAKCRQAGLDLGLVVVANMVYWTERSEEVHRWLDSGS